MADTDYDTRGNPDTGEPGAGHRLGEQARTQLACWTTAHRLASYLGYAIPLVIVGLFLFDKSIIRPLMYAGCLLPMAVYLYRVRLTAVWSSPYWRLVIVFCAWWLLSVAWSYDTTTESVLDAVRLGLIVALFFTGAISVARKGYLQVEPALTAMIVLALVLGLVVLAWLTVSGELFEPRYRLRGIGFADHPVHAGVMYGFAGVVALKRLLDGGRPGWRALYLSAFLTCAVVVVLTDSRGPLGAMIFASALLVSARDRRLLPPTILGFAMLLLAVQGLGLIDVAHWIQRGSASRLEIWSAVIDRALERPLIGHGAASVIDLFPHHSAHNAFVAAFYYQGAIGLAILLVFAARVAYDALVAAGNGHGQLLVLLAFAFPVLMVDNQSLIINLNRDWLVLYLPLLMLCQPGPRMRGSVA